MSNLRKKVMEILSVNPNELFTCPKCSRRFYIDLNAAGATVWFRDSVRGQFRNKARCKECSGISWPGETYL